MLRLSITARVRRPVYSLFRRIFPPHFVGLKRDYSGVCSFDCQFPKLGLVHEFSAPSVYTNHSRVSSFMTCVR